MKKKLRWVAWFETPVCFYTKKRNVELLQGENCYDVKNTKLNGKLS